MNKQFLYTLLDEMSVSGHEIGLIVTQIRDDGLIRVGKAGGIYPSVYPGHQVAVHGYAQTVYGAVVHSRDTEKSDLKVSGLLVDIGAKNAADARKYIREGDPIHLNTYHQEMLNGHLISRVVTENPDVDFIA